MRRIVLAGLVLLGMGCGPRPRYCAECAEIASLLAKGELSAVDRMDLGRLGKNLADKQASLAALSRLTGEKPNLHPECECRCHLFWVKGSGEAHDLPGK